MCRMVVRFGFRLRQIQPPRRDVFALAVPIGVALGRIGCLLHGCCPGVVCAEGWWSLAGADGLSRWPAAWVELGFNLTAAVLLFVMYRRGVFRHQLFHLYLLAYASFRIAHEPMRDTPRIYAGISGYQVLAGVILVFTAWRFYVRRSVLSIPPDVVSPGQ